MYLLIFQAWATLMGFHIEDQWLKFNSITLTYMNNGNANAIQQQIDSKFWEAEFINLSNFEELAFISPTNLLASDELAGGYYGINQAQQALMLTNIMTHVSMILIFVLIISFFIFLFRIFARMIRR